jgi:uncharacterized protein YbjQ (UPF0145 family)
MKRPFKLMVVWQWVPPFTKEYHCWRTENLSYSTNEKRNQAIERFMDDPRANRNDNCVDFRLKNENEDWFWFDY